MSCIVLSHRLVCANALSMYRGYKHIVNGAEYVLKLLPKGTHEYKKFIKPSELIRTTREENLDVIELIGLTYNPITKVYRLSKDTDVNYMVAFNK